MLTRSNTALVVLLAKYRATQPVLNHVSSKLSRAVPFLTDWVVRLMRADIGVLRVSYI